MPSVQEERKANGIEVLGWNPFAGVEVGYLAVGTGLPSQRLQVQGGFGFLASFYFPISICVRGSFIFNPTLLLGVPLSLFLNFLNSYLL